MNEERRKRLSKIVVKLDDMATKIEHLVDEEKLDLDSMDEAIDVMTEAYWDVDEAMAKLRYLIEPQPLLDMTPTLYSYTSPYPTEVQS